MKHTTPPLAGLLLPLLLLSFTTGSMAADREHASHHRMGHDKSMGKAMHEPMHHEGKGGHLFGDNWKQTLSDKQKTQIDKMHLELKKDLALLKPKSDLAKAELNQLIISNKPNTQAINKKINEITALKGELMKKRYAHIVEMRSVLTSEQRVSFDMSLLSGKHGGAKHRKH
jgi:Spy/CpxP family protein refolding chaperone